MGVCLQIPCVLYTSFAHRYGNESKVENLLIIDFFAVNETPLNGFLFDLLSPLKGERIYVEIYKTSIHSLPLSNLSFK